MKQLLCPSCRALNRVDESRISQAVCGRCAHSLAGEMLTLDRKLLDALLHKDELPLLADFWAPWCGPCRKMGPAFEEAGQLLGPGVRLGKLNTEEHHDVSSHFNVQSIPTLILFRGGRELDRLPGARPAQEIATWVRSRLGVVR